MNNESRLRLRTMQDYENQPVNRARKVDGQRRAAVEVAYSGLIQSVSIALKTGQSVLVRGPAAIARSLVQVIREKVDSQLGSSFYFFSIKDELERGSAIAGAYADVIALEHPAHSLLTSSLEPFIFREGNQERIGVLDFLDPFFSVSTDNQQDLLYLLHVYPEFQWLAFAHPSTILPPAAVSLFTYQFHIPPLTREDLWSLITYEEAQNLFGSNELSIATQVGLYHAVSGFDITGFRSLIESLNNENKSILQPTEGIARLRRIIAAGGLAQPRLEPGGSAEALQILHNQILLPFKRCSQPEVTEAEVDELDRKIPKAVLITGEMAWAEELARYLAGELNARFISTSGASLPGIEQQITALSPLPAVIWISRLEDALLGNGDGLSSLFRAWDQIDITRPIFIIAGITGHDNLPPQLRRRFTLEINCED